MLHEPPLKSGDLTSGTYSWISTSGSIHHGSWRSSTSSLNGWWWTKDQNITFESTKYDGNAFWVLDANNNGIYDDVDYEIFYSYSSGMGASGTWTFGATLLNGLLTSGFNGIGIMKSMVSFSYDLPNYNNSTIGSLNNDVITTFQGKDTIDARAGDDLINAGGGNDKISGGDGNDTAVYSGDFNDYSFIRLSDSLRIVDLRTTNEDGEDSLEQIEYIKFADQTVEESKVDVSKTYSGNFKDYKFYNKGDGNYEIKNSSTGTTDDITGYPSLQFTGEATTSSFKDISAIADIKGTFDQVTGLKTDSGEMFRLYNAAFARFPDADGLKYWIDEFSSGRNTRRVVAKSFLGSAEFAERYGANVSNAKYVETLYVNVLGRDYDQEGYNYWLGNLNNGTETRYELLLGFAESAENKTLFTEMTGLS